jgi:hypothetical protein
MPRKTISIYSDDDYERLITARTEVDIAERQLTEKRFQKAGTSARLGDADPDGLAAAEALVQEKKDACDAVIDAASENAEEWVIESIGFEAWEDLLEKWPPRKVPKDALPQPGETVAVAGEMVDHPEDAPFGVNTKEFGKALLRFVDPEDPDHRTVTKAGDLDLSKLPTRLRRLSRGQFDSLWITAFSLNTGGIADPKATRFSLAPRSTES